MASGRTCPPASAARGGLFGRGVFFVPRGVGGGKRRGEWRPVQPELHAARRWLWAPGHLEVKYRIKKESKTGVINRSQKQESRHESKQESKKESKTGVEWLVLVKQRDRNRESEESMPPNGGGPRKQGAEKGQRGARRHGSHTARTLRDRCNDARGEIASHCHSCPRDQYEDAGQNGPGCRYSNRAAHLWWALVTISKHREPFRTTLKHRSASTALQTILKR
eukprot:350083-Chlamydomonas_euryale.AAC.2